MNQDQTSAAEVRTRMQGKYWAEIMNRWWFIAIHRASYIQADTRNMSNSKHKETNLTVIGPCIVIYSYNKSQRDALFLKFISVKKSTCLGRSTVRR